MPRTVSILLLILISAPAVFAAVPFPRPAEMQNVQNRQFPHFEGPYLGQKAPVDRAEVFLDGVISLLNEAEMCAAFAPGGREFYFNKNHNNHWAIFYTRETEGKWTEPRPMTFTSNFTDRDFTISPDGRKIFFGSNRPREQGGKPLDSLDIYVTERLPSGDWSAPRNMGFPINSDRGENYPCAARSGNLYFFSCGREDSIGGCDLYVAEFRGGRYHSPLNLGPAVNSGRHDWDAYVAPDESFLIFSSQNRPDTLGTQDLYICFRTQKGGWSRAVNMGPRINSSNDEICPSMSVDGKYLFFTSRRRGRADIFWIDARIITEFKANR